MKPKQILLAVSGGIDSMVMLHRLYTQYGANHIHVAHCNFQLRGADSDEDEAFVKAISAHMKVSCDSKKFDTESYASEKGMGIQEAARELRYVWFFELMKIKDCSHLATAHHKGDSIETFFINLLRGSGPRGLSGIQEDEDRKIIRPLLDIDRAAIELYAAEHKITWREDVSNTSNKYLRNKIRHDLVPMLSSWRPGFEKVMMRTMDIQRSVAALIDEASEAYRKTHFDIDGETTRISLDGSSQEKLLLGHLFMAYGFNDVQLDNILTSNQSGKQVLSKTHVLTSDRGRLLLSLIKGFPEGTWEISEDLNTDELPFPLEFWRMEEAPEFFDPNPNIAYLNASKLQFPLSLCRWKEGNLFKPLGMNGKKLVSDFLIDAKVPLEEKKRTLVLMSGEEIVWLVGHRISEDFKCYKNTDKVIYVLSSHS
jgi:tRNA(Ile)-lysidine synthase